MLVSRGQAAVSRLQSVIRLGQHRNLAIMPTVEKASDTSEMEFPAPSHVSLSSQAAEVARAITEFYSNPDTVVKFSEETKAGIREELEKRISMITDSDKSNFLNVINDIPDEMRMGDNPLFEVHRQNREKKVE